MQAAHHRHDMSDKVWGLFEAHVPGRGGIRGVTDPDNRNFFNAVFLILQSGAQWRDLPPGYGD